MRNRITALCLMVVVLGLAGLLTGSVAGGSDTVQGLSRKQADAIAVRVLRPQSDKGDLILFGLPRPLAAGSYVGPADPVGASGRPAPARRLAGPAWLYWLERDPGALFSHPSEYLLVDDRTGRVLTRTKVGWYPAVNGRRPSFLASANGYRSRSHRVFARLRRTTSATDTTGRVARAAAVPAGTFKDDCVLMIGDYGDPLFKADFPALQSWASSVGLRSFYATPDGPSKTSPGSVPMYDKHLRANVKELVEKQGCRDVMIYAGGHGAAASETDGPSLSTGTNTIKVGAIEAEQHGSITGKGLARVLELFKTTTFKVKIMSCYSGRFFDALTKNGKPRFANLLIVEVSSQAARPSYGAWEPKPENPDRLSWFMNQNITGLEAWVASDDQVASSVALGGSLLAHALERAFELGRSANRSIRTRGSIPKLATNFLPLSFTRSSWQHSQGSTVCAEVSSEPVTAVNVAVSTNASRAPDPPIKTVQTGANGKAVATFRIFVAGDYAFGAAARKGVRTARSIPARLRVPFPQQPPAGGLVCPA